MQTSSSDSLIYRILHSVFFKRSQRRASRLLRNSAGLWDLLKNVSVKSGSLTDNTFVSNLQTLSRMIRAYVKGDYKVIPWTTLVKIVAALVYFVSPLDFIPDLLPVLGFSDDIAIVLWVLSSCTEEIKRFQEWEAAQAISVSDK
ncbi:YkvA family protein [Cytophagaceae bacterium DM2B3-1]|uniref:YkvA family protein n=1 Tax=Xanthocytophaga flava TaxID=3048013 RepID=A0AAE3QVB8_9BACT|nr:YkvA family protein [Xanthocytophaga flavus]MDJ1483218.1 YkvA family protein [Xanthocytophaga flavus]MDJ1494327.1 YkvA family protein [Xanthocytophaga flavus]